MKFNILLGLLILCNVVLGYDAKLHKEKGATGIKIDLFDWNIPDALNEDGTIDKTKLPKNSKYIEQLLLGSNIINKTHMYIGPNAQDKNKKYTGNHLSCSSCHAVGGTVQNQAGFVGIWARFPQYNNRADKIITLTDRINGCMQRSMNGKPIPANSAEMKAMLTYMHWLSQGVPTGAKTKGSGLANVTFINRAADPKKGKIVYEEKCSYCHGENGQGIQNPDWKNNGDYYIYPPLWGDDSYNTGAGMYRLIKAAQYIKSSMPKGDANLNDEEIFDVASYINSKPRPIKPDRESDFPDRRVKPADMDIGSYDDNFTVEEHRFGPYQQMMK